MSNISERFPEIGFLLAITPFEPLDSKNVEHAQEINPWYRQLQLQEVDILYIYGLGLGGCYEPLKGWLREKKERALVFIEEDLAVIDAFLKGPLAEEILANAQVYLRFKPDLEALAEFFPTDRILVTALPSNHRRHTKKIRKMRLTLQRSSAAMDALLTEVLLGHKLFKNLYPNFLRLEESFFVNAWREKFKNIPAVICGAGPSLEEAIVPLNALENRALIFAGGSTLTALSRHGVVPHLGMALDPNHLEFERLQESTIFENPLIYAPRLCADVFSLCNGPFGYLRSDTGGCAENWLERQLQFEEGTIGPDLGREALSVTTLAVALANALGCNPIILVGVDLAFTRNQTYASGVLVNNRAFFEKMKQEGKAINQLIRKKGREGKFVYTLVKWVMESAAISTYATAHPERQFINCTRGGIGFASIPYQPLETVIQKECTRSYDLRAWIHSNIQQTSLKNASSGHVKELFEEVQVSLGRCLHYVDEIITSQGKGRSALLELDFFEEPAFDCLLQNMGSAFTRLTQRFPEDNSLEKWRTYKVTIQNYLRLLNA